MKTIIAGSRSITDYNLLLEAYSECDFEITEVVSGGARGVDKLGERLAQEFNLPLKVFLADWSKGKQAGFTRNVQMAEYAEALIAIWDGQSRGTAHMINVARSLGLKVYVF